MDIQPPVQLLGLVSGNLSIVDLLAASEEFYDSSNEDGSSDSEDDADSSLIDVSPHHFESPASSIASSGPTRPYPPVRGESFTFISPQAVSKTLIQSLAIDEVDMIESAAERLYMNEESEGAAAGAVSDGDVRGSEEKQLSLHQLEEAFGKWCDSSEVLVDSIPCALYRGVLLKGLASLTNRRLLFFAYCPSLPEGLVKSGALTIHMPGRTKRRRLVWAELKNDSFSYFASSKTTNNPIGSCRLSQVKSISAYDPDHPRSFTISLIDGRIRKVEVDTEEALADWRNKIESTLFLFRQNSDQLRISLPLELVSTVEVQPYFAVAERFVISFSSDYASTLDQETALQTIELGYLKSHHSFSELLEAQLVSARANPAVCHVQPILEIGEGAAAVENSKLQAELLGDDKLDRGLAAKFVRQFALADSAQDLFVSPSCELIRLLPTWGALAISAQYLCFWRKSLAGADTKLRIPIVDLEDISESKAFGFRIYGLRIRIHGAADIRFDFKSRAARDSVVVELRAAMERIKVESASKQRRKPHRDTSIVFGQTIDEIVETPNGSIVLKRPAGLPAILNVRTRGPIVSRHFFCLTIGSRGDVQPYIALGKALMEDGHRVTIASHPEYRDWVESFGIGYRDVGGDPTALMELTAAHAMFSPGFFKESIGHFRNWLDLLLVECWNACQEADVLIESPATMAGIHVAEALHIPYFRCFTMPWTSTSSYPHAFSAGGVDLGPIYNQLSYSLFDTVIWKATAGQVNKWRKTSLGLKSTNLSKLSQTKTPFIYNFSSSVVPRPNDYPDWVTVAGYFFLDTPDKDWNPSPSLLAFIAKAREDEKPLIYIGFGSIVVQDSAAVTKAVVGAVLATGVRAILAKGWSDRATKSSSSEEVELPEEVFSLSSIPHDRLFPLLDLTVTHGGSGSTAASLRAGLVTLIHPFFGDQYFWANTVQNQLHVGLKIDSLSQKDLARAIRIGTTDRIMKQKAEMIGEKLRAENGPRNAIEFIYSHLHLAAERTEIRSARASHVPTHLKLESLTRSLSLRSSNHCSSPTSRSPASTAPGTPNESSIKEAKTL